MAYNAKAIDDAIAALIGTGGPATSKFQYKPGTISYKPTKYKNVNVASHLTADMFNYKPKKSSAKKKSSGDPWWKEALWGMNGVGGSVTNQVANWTDGKGLDMRDLTPSALLKSQVKSWSDGKLGWDDLAGSGVVKALKKGNKNDIPGYETAANIAKGQAKAWTDGEFGFKDIPGFGGLVYAGKKNKGTEQILENAGWKDKKGLGLHDIASFIGDVALDPTTYVTFGGASALKAGSQAAKNAAKSVGLKHGIEDILKGFKGGADNIANHASQQVYKKALSDYGKSAASKVGKGAKSNTAEARKFAQTKADKAFKEITDSLKAARNKSQNNLVNFDVPFTNITSGMGKLPKSFIKKDVPIGKTGGAQISKLLEKYGVTGSKQADLLKKHYNVAKPEELGMQAMKHLQDTLKNLPNTGGVKNVDINQLFSAKNLGNYAPIKSALPSKTNMQQFLADNSKALFGKKVDIKAIKGLKVPNSSKNLEGIAKLLQNPPAKSVGAKLSSKDLTKLSEQINASRTVLKNFQKGKVSGADIKWKGATNNARNVDTALSKNKFVQDMGGKSKVGQYLADKLFSAINARSLGSADPFVNAQATHIAEADNFIRGNRSLMQSQISKVEKMAKKLSENDMKMIPYMIEKKYPGKMSSDEFLSQASNLPQLKKVAGEIENILGNIKQRGLESGTLTAPIKNYFPHMMQLNNDPEAITKLMSDPNIQKLLNSSVDKSNQSRKSFDSFASWKDAISALEDSKKGLTNPEDIANIDEKIGQLNQLFEENPIKAVQQRYQSSVRSMAMKDMYDNFRSNGVLKPRDAATPAEKTSGTYHPLSKNEAAKLGMKEGDLMHKEVFDGLKKVDSIFTDQGINNVVESLNAVTGIWKSLVTTFVPTHHLYNLVGNIANNSMAGVTPAMYTKAGKILAKAKAGKLTAAEEKMMQKAYDYGVLGGGYKADRFDPIRQARLENNKLARIADKVSNSRFSNFMNGAGNVGDDVTRLALFLHGTKREGTMKGGADMVRKYLYNYSEQTSADKVMKIAMPFWNWTKNNIPRQLMEFMQQPRYANTYMKFQNMLSEDRPEGPSWTNDYLQYGDKKFWNARLPLQDLTSVGKPLDTALNSMNPLLKVPIEYKMNKQFFNGQPIDWNKRDDETPYRADALAKYFSNQAGMVGKGYDAATNDKSWLEDLRNILIGKPIEVK